MEYEDILKEVGDQGRFQKTLLLFFGAAIALVAPFPDMTTLFMVSVPAHTCHIPNVFEGKNGSNSFLHFEKCSSCKMTQYVLMYENESFVNVSKETSCIYGYDFDKTYFDSTVSTKWDLVCENSHYPSLILTLQNVGSLLGTPVYGALADRFGRKTMCFALMLLSSVTDLSSVLVDNIFLFIVLRMINGTVLPVMFNLPYILISEFMAPNKRVLVNGVFNTFWMTGMCFIPLVAYLVRNWVLMGIANSVFIASVFVYIRFVPESASWLISRKKYKEATKIMMSIAEKNKKVVNESDLAAKLEALGEKSKQGKEEKNGNFFLFMIKNPRLRKHFLILTFSWMANTLAYMILQYNVINLGGNVFLNFFLLSLVEFPGNVIFWIMMERLGRRWSATIGFLSTCLCCLLPITGLEYTAIISSTIGKLITSGMYMVTDQQGCELCPTVSRSLAISTGKSIAMISILFTPFIAYLSIYGKAIPFVIISIVSFAASILSSFLPETLNENLPQTYSDAENFGKDQKFFSLNRKQLPDVASVPEKKMHVSTIDNEFTAYSKNLPKLLSWKNINQEKF